jgi:hypothetical protein
VTDELCRFGYTPREAGFLMLAGLQSGYFLRSQFNAHIERECGALGQQFIDRALRLGHIRALPGFDNQRLYHVCARALYQQIGEPDNRNRRLHAPETVRQRLMMLDYVLARPGEHCLLTAAARRETVARLVSQNSLDVDARLVDELLADRKPISETPRVGCGSALLMRACTAFRNGSGFSGAVGPCCAPTVPRR